MATVGEIIRGTVVYTDVNASVANNVFYWELSGSGITDNDLVDELGASFNSFWAERWKQLSGDTAELVYIAFDVIGLDGLIVRTLGQFPVNTAGFISMAENAPAAVAAYLLAQTVKPRQRGSKYIPFIAEGLIASGKLNTTALGWLGMMLIWYLGTITTGGSVFTPGLLSRTLAQFVPFLPEGLVQDIPAYQRRRKPNVGS